MKLGHSIFIDRQNFAIVHKNAEQSSQSGRSWQVELTIDGRDPIQESDKHRLGWFESCKDAREYAEFKLNQRGN